MNAEFRLPDLGEGLREAEIVQWLVAEGDEVGLNQALAEVETAKAIVELPSPHAGRVTALRHAVGDTVEVGEVLVAFEVAGSEPAAPAPAAEGSRSSETPAREPNLVGYGAAPRTSGRPQRRTRSGRPAPQPDTDVLTDAPHDALAEPAVREVRVERPRSTPPVRAFARQHGVDLALVPPSGPDGLITRADVEAYRERTETAATPAAAAPAARADAVATEREERIPIRGVRKATADAMVRSAFTAPHATSFLTIDVTATQRLLADLRADRRFADARIGILAVAAKAVCHALAATPDLNSRWDGDAGEIVRRRYVNLGIAAATERGLLVPNVKDADRLGLVDLAAAIRDLVATARAGKTSPAQLQGGTFSISNFGALGMDAGTPILLPGEAGILGLGAVRRMPWEHEGQIALRDVLTLSLSFDHRLVDGAEAARFLAGVADVLREPGRALLLV